MATRKKVTLVRYCIVSDDSGHDYFCPEDKKDEWYKWAYGPDAELGVTPDYAMRIDGRFTFTDPRCD